MPNNALMICRAPGQGEVRPRLRRIGGVWTYVAKCEQTLAAHGVVIRIFTKDGSLMALLDLEVPEDLAEAIDGAGDVDLFSDRWPKPPGR